jgi:uncharacterized protein (TIGR03000 family)
MYSIVLALALAPGNAAPADINTDISDLKRGIAELREEQTQARVDELKLVIGSLRQRITDDKLDEIRRDLHILHHEEAMMHMHAHSRAFYMPSADPGLHRATVAVNIPAGAAFTLNNHEIYVPAVDPVFYTPPLEPGKDFFYECKVTVSRDGKNVTKAKRVRVRAGEIVQINYEDMESR